LQLAEFQASHATIVALAGQVSRAVMERYSDIRMEVKRRAANRSGWTNFATGAAQVGHRFLHRTNPKGIIG